MLRKYEEYLEIIENEAVRDGLSDFRLAREEFHRLTGKFEDSDPWYELRMAMFLDWYLLDRPGPDTKTPTERYLTRHWETLSPEERHQIEHMTVTLRSVFRLLDLKGDQLKLEDLARGGHWSVLCTMPTVGFNRGDILEARIVFFNGKPTIGRGTVLHLREAHGEIESIIARAKQERMSPRDLPDHLDKMRLKLDRYSNVRIQHVYRYPGDTVF